METKTQSTTITKVDEELQIKEQEDDGKNKKEIQMMLYRLAWIKKRTKYSSQQKIIEKFMDLYNVKLHPVTISKISKTYRTKTKKEAVAITLLSLSNKKINLLIKFTNTIYNNRNMDEEKFLEYKFKEFEVDMQERFNIAMDTMKRECNL